MILLAYEVSCMNQNATSIPTVSESINVQRGPLQSSNAVSHRRSCATTLLPGKRKRTNMAAMSEVFAYTVETKNEFPAQADSVDVMFLALWGDLMRISARLAKSFRAM